jgi:anti-sigma B factor antagonist
MGASRPLGKEVVVSELTLNRRDYPNDVVCLNVRGEIEAANFVDFDDEVHDIIDEGAQALIIDLSRVSYMTSAGIGVLVGAHKDMTNDNKKVVFVRPRPEVMAVLESTKLDQLFIIVETQEQALEFTRQEA